MEQPSFFHRVTGARALLKSKGVLREVNVFMRDGRLYGKWGSGYIGLSLNGSTAQGVECIALDAAGCEKTDGFGRYIISPGLKVAS